jgi:hypothetical protein
LIYRTNPGGQFVLQQDLSIAYGAMAIGHPDCENGRFFPPPFSPNMNLLLFFV